MSAASDETETALSSDEAFAVLGNEIRMEILQTLGEGDEPLSFSELRKRVDVPDSGQFNYHLDVLRGHFVGQSPDGYILLQAGHRVIEAVLSGVVTDTHAIEEAPVDIACPYCGGQIEVDYDETAKRPIRVHCRDCAGHGQYAALFEHGQLGSLRLPPAGIHSREPTEIVQAAVTRDHLEFISAFNSICPKCSAKIDRSLTICEEHDASADRCAQCDRPYATSVSFSCTTCTFQTEPTYGAYSALINSDFLGFLFDNDIDPIRDFWGPVFIGAEENVLSTDQITTRFTFSIEEEDLVLEMNEDFTLRIVSENRS